VVIEDAKIVGIDYTDYRGERSLREVVPISWRFGVSEWHTEPQWLMRAYDIDKQAEIDIAMDCIHKWDR